MRAPLPALAFVLTLAACGRTETTARPDTAQVTPPPDPSVGPLMSLAKAAGESWNDAQIAWQPYEAGLAQAKAQNKPVCLVLFTTWCPHCKNYSRVFDDPRVVERAKDFVMIRLDSDKERAIGAKYGPDGTYVPRTFFLAPDGTLAAEIHAPRPQYKYFYDERDPASVLGGMSEALKKLAGK